MNTEEFNDEFFSNEEFVDGYDGNFSDYEEPEGDAARNMKAEEDNDEFWQESGKDVDEYFIDDYDGNFSQYEPKGDAARNMNTEEFNDEFFSNEEFVDGYDGNFSDYEEPEGDAARNMNAEEYNDEFWQESGDYDEYIIDHVGDIPSQKPDQQGSKARGGCANINNCVNGVCTHERQCW